MKRATFLSLANKLTSLHHVQCASVYKAEVTNVLGQKPCRSEPWWIHHLAVGTESAVVARLTMSTQCSPTEGKGVGG
jgi:hypothetical protein